MNTLFKIVAVVSPQARLVHQEMQQDEAEERCTHYHGYDFGLLATAEVVLRRLAEVATLGQTHSNADRELKRSPCDDLDVLLDNVSFN